MYEHVLLYAKKRGAVPRLIDYEGRIPGKTHYYDITYVPPTPLRVGMVVRIHEVEDRGLNDSPRGRRDPYTAESTGIVGTITGIRALEKEITEFVVKHEDDRDASWVKNAYIAVPHIQGVTVDLPMWLQLLRWIMLPHLAQSRIIYIEDNFEVVDNVRVWRSDEPDPVMRWD